MRTDDTADLPAGLAALGEQLSDDAARLAACYPAGPMRNVTVTRSHRPVWRLTAAAALLVAGSGAAGWIVGQFGALGDASRHAVPVAGRPAASATTNDAPRQVTPATGEQLTGEPVTDEPCQPSPAVPVGHDGAAPLVERHAVGRRAASRPVSFGPPGQPRDLEQTADEDRATPRLPRDEAALLRAQIDAFAQVIERLQAELVRRDEAQRETNKLIQSLTDEVARLREQLDASAEDSPE